MITDHQGEDLKGDTHDMDYRFPVLVSEEFKLLVKQANMFSAIKLQNMYDAQKEGKNTFQK